MTTAVGRPPRICLSMIVRNEAGVIHELIESVAGHIQSWVIVDTGSTDGTQDVIRRLMKERGIPGTLYERPWRDFGSNRTQALELAQGQGDYIWVMDADDTVSGTIDFSQLSADAYTLRISDGTEYWRVQLFRDGVPWRYSGVLHEVAVCAVPHTVQRLEGNYRIHSRRLGSRNRDPQKYARDAEVLLAEVTRNPDDRRSVFYLAQSYFDAGDFANARTWYERRAAMGGWEEEVFWSLFRTAHAMNQLGEPWPTVQDAFLRAWAARPGRAEPLYCIARHYRVNAEYQLGYFFAERAAQIPLPKDDILFVPIDVYQWRALDEQAVCGSWIGKYRETHAICQRLLARDDLPERDRTRIAANCDLAASSLGESSPTAATPPLREAMTRRLLGRGVIRGEIRIPAVPAMLDEHVEMCTRTFTAVGVVFTVEQTAQLRAALAGQMATAFAASPRSEILITYDSPVGLSVNYHVKPLWSTLAEAYDTWVATRQPPYFGSSADARVWSLACELVDPAASPVFDIGAGPGRNSIPLARRGHPVDAVEMSRQFAGLLRSEAERASLPIRVFERDVFATRDGLRHDYRLILLSEVTPDFRTTEQLRNMFALAAECLAPGGRLVFNIFLPRGGYVPDAAARELGQQVYTSIFTREELQAATTGLPLDLAADDSVHDYEQEHLPPGAWPPTPWYAAWVSGLDVFDVSRDASPIEMRWLVYQKSHRS